jgi:hypothetical protein
MFLPSPKRDENRQPRWIGCAAPARNSGPKAGLANFGPAFPGGTMLLARIRPSSPASLPFPDMSKMEQTDVSADRQNHQKVQIAHPNVERNSMSKEAAHHHTQAAEHHDHAARHHREAAKHHLAGNHEKAAHHAHLAHGHLVHATEHAENAAKEHVKAYGTK